MNRRGLLGAILGAGFAPAAIGSGILMPINKKIIGSRPIPLMPEVRIKSIPGVSDEAKVAAMLAFVKTEMHKAMTGLLVDGYYTYPTKTFVQRMEEESARIGVKSEFRVGSVDADVIVTTPNHTGVFNVFFS